MGELENLKEKFEIDSSCWLPLEDHEKNKEKLAEDSMTYWQDAWRRLKKDKLAIASMIFLLFVSFAAIFGPMIVKYPYEEQNLEYKNLPFILDVRIIGEDFYLHPQKELNLVKVNKDGTLDGLIHSDGIDMISKSKKYLINGKEYLLKYVDGNIELLDSDGNIITNKKTLWNKTYILGTDSLGRDMLSRIIYGSRISMTVALISSLVTFLIGVFYGGISGYYGGALDNIMMRFAEILATIPNVMYVILLMVYLGQGIINLLIAMAITSWIGMARLVRGQVLTLRQREFVLAAKAIGVKPFNTVMRHLIPNCAGQIIVTATLSIPGAIFTEAFLSFIGLGVAPPMPSWGTLCNAGLETIRTFPYQIFLPALAISLTMFAFNFLGDGLRDALDPRMRK